MAEYDGLARDLVRVVAQNGLQAPLRICEAVVASHLADGAAVTLISDPDRQEPICATDEIATRLDELQFSLAEGPCLDAHTSGRPVLVADITDPADTRWPGFAEGARGTRARALYALPMRIGGARLGVLDLYRLEHGPLSRGGLTMALRAADAATWAVLNPGAGGRQAPPGVLEDLIGAGLARAEVHQATGMVAVQLGVPVGAALARLRAHAFAHGRPLADVAHDVVTRRLRLDSTDDPPGDDRNLPGGPDAPSGR
ncbi:GAF domain-containing protein [Actinopolymorpha singaporensis]|uniref:GAF domain-containing protein n=1 Tax=Actinopolymorpha singaporensis TaxID=117157 RepID=A0A1H1Y264_9ACTN|nr:GAF domain-containing protein [Actinopolymorpha singaporensis]SDT15558.1 GAF domain-containing protein [Actinopolymorpha singaporensis]